MRRTSLRRRVTLTGVAVVAALVLALDVFVYLNLRDRLLTNLEKVLDARQQLAQSITEEVPRIQLRDRLEDAGLRAVLRTAEGSVLTSGGAPPLDAIPAGGDRDAAFASRRIPLPEGGELFVLASRGGIDAALHRLLLLETVGSVAAVGLAYLVLSRSSVLVLRPVRDVASTARRIAGGRFDERLSEHEDDRELAEMVTAFNTMLDALEDAIDRSRNAEEGTRQFLADAAHQLRTPVAGVRASVASLLRSDDPAERDRMLDNLARETARMSRLLSSLLRVARLDSLEAPTFAPARVDDVVREAVDRQRELSPLHRFELTGADHVAVIDAAAVQEAVGNLLDNASRHAAGRVVVTIEATDGEVSVNVRDDGPGLAAEDRERVFHRFVSLDGAGGSGLGLSIARGIAEAHGGSLEYRDGGFRLRLPTRQQAGATD